MIHTAMAAKGGRQQCVVAGLKFTVHAGRLRALGAAGELARRRLLEREQLGAPGGEGRGDAVSRSRDGLLGGNVERTGRVVSAVERKRCHWPYRHAADWCRGGRLHARRQVAVENGKCAGRATARGGGSPRSCGGRPLHGCLHGLRGAPVVRECAKRCWAWLLSKPAVHLDVAEALGQPVH